VADFNQDGVPDLAVSNDEGDVLILIGNGDGTFRPYQRADNTVSLAVGDLTGNGQTDVVLSSAALDQLTVESPGASTSFQQGRENGLRAPGAPIIADLEGNGIPDLIVANTGANEVLVYLGEGGGRFAPPQRFYTGMAPIGVTVADLEPGGLPDLVVADSGSDDVTILLGRVVNGHWTLVNGPRLRVGQRPVATTVTDVYGDGIPDILVVNQDDNSVMLLRGLGHGFFEDQAPVTFATGGAPVQAFVGHFSSAPGPGLAVLDSQTNDVTYYADIANAPDAPPVMISTGNDPVAGVMGRFHGDGFDDLAVANNGDGTISMFYGGPQGLTFAESLQLDGSARPTSLALSTSPDGALQLYVAAAGESNVIAVPLTTPPVPRVSIIAAPGLAPVFSAVVTGGSSAAVVVRTSGPTVGATPTPIQLTSATFEEGDASESEGVAAAQAGGGSGAAASASGSSGSAAGGIAQAIAPVLSPSLGSLSWLLDTLVQFGQAETWDILPLGESDMAAVAIILPTFSLADPSASGTARGSSSSSQDSLAAYGRHDRTSSPPLTEAVRFAVDFEGAFAALALEARDVADRSNDSGWVWRQETARIAFGPAAGSDSPPIHPQRPGSVDPDPGADIAVNLEPTLVPSAAPEASALSLAGRLLSASLLLLSSGLLAWTRLRWLKEPRESADRRSCRTTPPGVE
jgi:hypothetical protein